VYSSDFPWSIDFKKEINQKLPILHTPVGSLSSLTFFSGMVMRRQYHLLGLESNFYMRRSSPENREVESHGFRNWYGFDKEGKRVEGGGITYHLSTVLGITSNYGMSVDEVVENLRRSATADGKKPTGTIYFCKSGDKDRSGPREPVFSAAAAELKKLGV